MHEGDLAYCRERSKLEMELAHMRAQMEQVVEADMEALQVPSLAYPVRPRCLTPCHGL